MDYKKEIYASIEIADHEVRVVVGEFYETRFHVLRVEKCETKGVLHKCIVDEQDVVNAITKAIGNVEEILGYRIRRVLLALPSVNVLRCTKRVEVVPKAISKRICLSDIQKGLNEAISYKPDSEHELVNVSCIKYVANGITSRKMPIDEICDVLTMNVDLLYADKNIVYSYARCIEESGLEILDVCLDSYAIAQEAAIFEQTVDKYVVLVNLSKQDTTLSLFSRGKLVNSELIKKGYADWLIPIQDFFGFSEKISYRLLQNTCTFDSKKAKDQVIYVWSVNNQQFQLTERQVCQNVSLRIRGWFDMINETCKEIVADGEVRYILTGDGFNFHALSEMVNLLNAQAMIYIPQTVGARDCSYVTTLGLFYSWKEQNVLRNDERISVNEQDINDVLSSVAKKNSSEENGFTKKLKSILFNEK